MVVPSALPAKRQKTNYNLKGSMLLKLMVEGKWTPHF